MCTNKYHKTSLNFQDFQDIQARKTKLGPKIHNIYMYHRGLGLDNHQPFFKQHQHSHSAPCCLFTFMDRADIYHWYIALESRNTMSDRLILKTCWMRIQPYCDVITISGGFLSLPVIWGPDVCYYTDHPPAQQLWPVATTWLTVGHITAPDNTYRPRADVLTLFLEGPVVNL